MVVWPDLALVKPEPEPSGFRDYKLHIQVLGTAHFAVAVMVYKGVVVGF
jgi:hypothetical protein